MYFFQETAAKNRRVRPGLTLIELVVVLAILAAVAGLVIPKIDFLRRSADTATGAAGIQDVMTNLQLYKTVKGIYPGQFDSLIESTGTNISSKVWGSDGVHTSNFEVATIPDYNPAGDQSALSFAHVIGTTLYDLNDSATFASDAGSVARDVSSLSAFKVATVRSTSALAQSIFASYSRIITPAVPAVGSPGDAGYVAPVAAVTSNIPSGITLVALGVGPRCTAIGTTMSNAPIYGALGPDQYYSRFIGIFAIYSSGKRAELVGVVDPIGQVASTQLKAYYQNVPDND